MKHLVRVAKFTDCQTIRLQLELEETAVFVDMTSEESLVLARALIDYAEPTRLAEAIEQLQSAQKDIAKLKIRIVELTLDRWFFVALTVISFATVRAMGPA